MVFAGLLAVAVGCKTTKSGLEPLGDGGTLPACLSDDAGAGNRSNGETCGCGADCASGFCVDKLCCDTACEGTCQSCSLPTSLGTCALTPAGVTPSVASQCVKGDVATCGLDGTCDGTGRCRTYEAGTVCSKGMCEADAVVGTNVCDGAGHCRLGAATVCAPFSCDPATSQCFPACTSDANCVSGRRCVNGSCGPKMNGAVCVNAAECASGNCVDGVCCNTACGGACRSCNQVGLEGTCSPVPAGLPHPLCLKQAAATCGTAGVCDGFGSCAFYPDNSPCGPSSCAGVTAMNTARACDGLGTCEVSTVTLCGNYRCANGACNARCTTNADCADGIACVNNSCGPKVDGQTCAVDTDCQNMHCVRDVATSAMGICCNTACAGACRSCGLANHLGVCFAVPVSQPDPRRVCVDMTAATCGNNGNCDGAMGCQKYPVGQQCGAQTCTADMYTAPSTCNALGQCLKPGAVTCFPYHCNAATCFNSCTTNAQCIAPNSCGMNGMISSCGLKPPGATCTVAAECGSGFCADGVCCNNSCNNACQMCNIAASRGTCTNVNSGADPHNICAAQAQSTCGTTGQCAAGVCAHWAAGTVCRPSAGTCDPQETCSGTGAACPANALASAATPCRGSAGMCDIPETCTGTSATCPADALRPTGFVCRAAAGLCDLAETCSGTSAACPNDALAPATTLCRPAAAGGCDVAENCTGTTAVCPADAFRPSTFACRGAAGECDIAENCPGNSATCAADVLKANGTACTADTNACTLDRCNGTNPACQHPAAAAGTACGTGPACSVTAFKTQDTCVGTTCTVGASTPINDNNACTADSCTVTGGVAHSAVAPGTACGVGPSCSATAFKAQDTCVGTTCAAGASTPINDNNACTADSCTFTGGVAHTAVAPGTTCGVGPSCSATVFKAQDICVGTTCTAGASTPINDNNQCTADSCSVTGGVANTPVAPGTACGAGAKCVIGAAGLLELKPPDACDQRGACVAGVPAACPDAMPICDPQTNSCVPIILPTCTPNMPFDCALNQCVCPGQQVCVAVAGAIGTCSPAVAP